MRALLAFLGENEAAERPMPPVYLQECQTVLSRASKRLTILAPELGDQELIKSVAAEVAKVRCLREV